MILLTGFEPFAGAAFNPSMAIAEGAAAKLRASGMPAEAAQLPCVFALAPAVLNELLEVHAPEVVITLGLAAGRNALSLEKVAINHLDARIPDNAGDQPIDEPVLADAPSAYFSTLPLKTALKHTNGNAGGVRAEISYSAGTFVCNQVFYALMHRLATEPGVRGGFIHVPWFEPGDPRIDEFAHAVAEVARLTLAGGSEPVFSAGLES